MWKALNRHFKPDNLSYHISTFSGFKACCILLEEDIDLFSAQLSCIFDELNEFEIKLPEIFHSFQLLRFLPEEFDSIVQLILRWKLSDFKYESILTELKAEKSRLKSREKHRASTTNAEVQIARKLHCVDGV